MNKSLPQITATFLSILLTFIAAYLIFILTEKSAIENDILLQGSEIFLIIQNPKINEYPSYILVPQAFREKVSKKYSSQYPSELYKFQLIENDYLLSDLCANERRGLIVQLNRDDNFCKTAFPDSELTSLFFFLVEQYFNYISPSEYFPGKLHEQKLSAFPDTLKAKTNKFPLGLTEAEKWSDDYLVVYNEIHHLYKILKIISLDSGSFDDRYESYIKNIANPRHKKILHDFNYKDWLDDMYKTFTSLTQNNIKVQGLLKQKQQYNFRVRLPHITWIIGLSIFCFLGGIVLPIMLEIFNRPLPRIWDATISSVVILLIVLITYFFAVDIISTLKL